MRGAAVILGLAIALGGCGASGERDPASGTGGDRIQGDWGPARPGSGDRARPVAPPRRPPSAAVASALEAGTVGVIGVEGAVGVRPSVLAVSADGTLEHLRWRRWDATGAEGAGTLRLRDCDPSCASGGIDSIPATVRLSAPRLCGRATYFDRARVELEAAQERPGEPVSYVRAPC